MGSKAEFKVYRMQIPGTNMTSLYVPGHGAIERCGGEISHVPDNTTTVSEEVYKKRGTEIVMSNEDLGTFLAKFIGATRSFRRAERDLEKIAEKYDK